MKDDLREIADRRKWLMTAPAICMECGSGNIELTDPGKNPAKWKCRKCSVRFEREPKDLDGYGCRKCHPRLCRCDP